MKRKLTAIAAALLVCSFLLTACGKGGETNVQEKEKLEIVCTMFPMYDWVLNILGEKAQDAEITLLLDSGVDLHSYQPTAEDIIKIHTADIFVYVGGESDKWVTELSATGDLSSITMFSLLENLGSSVVEEEIVEGMEAEEEEEEGDEEEAPEYDEHVWLSLKNASVLTEKLAAAIGGKDADNAAVYTQNAKAYCEKLSALDAEFTGISQAFAKDTLVVADRFPFRYLCDDYDIKYYAAFSGCSAESEAAFSTITFLADKVNELGLTKLLKTETSDGSIADTVKNTAGREEIEILTVNAMQSVTADKMSGTSYYDIMKDNLETLKNALS